ncbi:MAG: phospholipase D family protein [Candidatus Omnitrophica bacterium]|nr:phospholipase D family protein [Candidatus Omnitrophota bacterium]
MFLRMKYFISALILFLLIEGSSYAFASTEVYFSPNGGCQGAVISEIGKAKKSIEAAMYSFTSREIAQALIEAKKRGVKVRVVLDNAQIKDHFSKSRYLINKGLSVKFLLGPGLMHNKFAVIDSRVVLTGSFNWTTSADKKNAENLLVISDKELGQKYAKQFKHLWGQSGEGIFKEDKSEGKE